MLLDDYENQRSESENFLDYYDRQGEKYFYSLLVHLSSAENLQDEDFIDWGNTGKYVQAVGVGECAGVVIDLVATLLLEAKEKVNNNKIY